MIFINNYNFHKFYLYMYIYVSIYIYMYIYIIIIFYFFNIRFELNGQTNTQLLSVLSQRLHPPTHTCIYKRVIKYVTDNTC